MRITVTTCPGEPLLLEVAVPDLGPADLQDLAEHLAAAVRAAACAWLHGSADPTAG